MAETLLMGIVSAEHTKEGESHVVKANSFPPSLSSFACCFSRRRLEWPAARTNADNQAGGGGEGAECFYEY